MIITLKLLCVVISVLFLLQLTDAAGRKNSSSRSSSSSTEDREEAPFLKNIDKMRRSKSFRIAKRVLSVTGKEVSKLGEEVVEKLNENHNSKRGKGDNDITPNVIKHNVLDPAIAVAQVIYRKTSDGVGEVVSEVSHTAKKKMQKASNGINETISDANYSIKQKTKKPIAITSATGSVVKNKTRGVLQKTASLFTDSSSEERKSHKKDKNGKKSEITQTTWIYED